MADLSQSSWSETDAQNNQAAPLGWTPGVMLPTQVEPTAQAMMGAMKRYWNRQNPTYSATLTTTDTYTVSPQTPVTSYTAFELWRVRFPSANLTTSPTVTLGPGAALIQKYTGGSLGNVSVGDIQAKDHEVYYNGAAAVMVLTNPGLNGNVNGPASSATNNLPAFTDTTGKNLGDSGRSYLTLVSGPASSTSQSLAVFSNTSGTLIGNGFIVGTGPSNIPQLNSSSLIPAALLTPATATTGGAVPTPPNNTTTFLRGDATFAAPLSSQVLLATLTASNSATLSDTTHLTSTYTSYEFRFINVIPATNSVNLWARVGTSGGGYDSGASSYAYYGVGLEPAARTFFSAGDAQIVLNPSGNPLSNTVASGGVSGVLRLFNPAGTTTNKQFTFDAAAWNSSSEYSRVVENGAYINGTAAITQIEFLFSSGNIASGTIEVWGVP